MIPLRTYFCTIFTNFMRNLSPGDQKYNNNNPRTYVIPSVNTPLVNYLQPLHNIFLSNTKQSQCWLQ